jgi:hypothetical protein
MAFQSLSSAFHFYSFRRLLLGGKKQSISMANWMGEPAFMKQQIEKINEGFTCVKLK